MHEYLIALRLVHILSGVLWAGGIFMLALFVIPAINASGAEGSKVMRQIASTNHYATVMTIAATSNIIAGLLLYWQISRGLTVEWITSSQGISISIGGSFAIIAYVIGMAVNRPSALRIAEIGGEIAAAGGKPTESQITELNKLRKKITDGTNYMAYLLAITVSAMAIARYIG